jgi:hypothetical protein
MPLCLEEGAGVGGEEDSNSGGHNGIMLHALLYDFSFQEKRYRFESEMPAWAGGLTVNLDSPLYATDSASKTGATANASA